MKKLYQKAKINIDHESINEENGSLYATFSTEDEDRHGDIVRQDWDLKNFKQNPVIINSHQYGDATEVIGKVEDIKTTKDKQLEGKVKFAVAENPKAKIIFDLYAGGFLSAFSVGFIPKEFSDKGEIIKSELLEISTVSVPSNAMALAKRKGINVEKLIGEEKTDKKEEKSPPCRQEGESKEDCVERKIPELIDEGYDREQAVAIANDMCKSKCEEKGVDIDKESIGGGDITISVSDSEYLWDSHINLLEGVYGSSEEEEDEEEEKEVKKNKGNQDFASLLSQLCEKIEVETRFKNDRAKRKRLFNKAIRKLVKSKSR